MWVLLICDKIFSTAVSSNMANPPSELKYWKWGFSIKKNTGGSLQMQELPTFPLLFLGPSNCGKETLFRRSIRPQADPFSGNGSSRKTGVLSGVRSITVGTKRLGTCCWSEVLCVKGDCFDEDHHETIHHLWTTARGVRFLYFFLVFVLFVLFFVLFSFLWWYLAGSKKKEKNTDLLSSLSHLSLISLSSLLLSHPHPHPQGGACAWWSFMFRVRQFRRIC